LPLLRFPQLRLIFVVVAAWAVPATAAPLRIGVESADRPLSFVNAEGKPDGFTAELLRETSRAGGVEIEIVANRWSPLLADFYAGKIDVLANVAITADRIDRMDFSIGHAHVHGMVYSRRDRPRIRTTADFAGKTIATLQGSIASTNAIAHHGWGAALRPFGNPQEAVDATVRGECDAVLLIYAIDGKNVADDRGLRHEFVDDIIHRFHFAVHKGDAATLARLNDGLATVLYNGTFDRLYDHWIGPLEPHPIRWSDLRPYYRSIALGIAAIAAIIWWQRRMLRRVSQQAQALRDSEERFRGLVDSAYEGWIIHQDGVIVTANASAAAMFGYTVSEFTGKLVLDPLAPEARDEVAAAIQRGNETHLETVGLRRDGSRVPLELAGKSCKFEGRPARIVAVRDLTSRRQAEADRLVLSKLESTGVLAGGIAHDFNNLLASIVLNLDMAQLTQPRDPAIERYLEAARRGALAATNLTQQFITFARGGTSVRRPVEVATLLEHTVPLALSGSNVRSEILLPGDLWRTMADPGQVERVVGNLVINAREAMPAGGVMTVRAQNFVVAAHEHPHLGPGEYVRVTFTDRGPGIPVELQSRIFDPYFTTKQRGAQKGMGLGLTISHSIVQKHGGALTVESTPGDGASFHVYLPATHEPAGAPAQRVTRPLARTGTLLVMDDEGWLRDSLKQALEQSGLAVVLAGDGQEAVRLYAQARSTGRPFDVVLLDLTVRGGMGGREALLALRTLDPGVKAIAMSGYSSDEVMQDHVRHGFRAALAKPFDLETLQGVLAQVQSAK
jgi:two-component system cell cycle sensor histidine kinase/response regulator CckA